MRTALLFCLFAVFGNTATAQFRILPQVGVENFRTSIEFNELSSFSPLCQNPSPMAGLRLDYSFKKMHGPFIGIATSRSIVKYSFSDPVTGMKDYTASGGQTQIRLEAGYQVSSKPFYFKKPGSINVSSKSHCQRNVERVGCGSKANRSESFKQQQPNKGSWVRLVPSVGVAYIPSAASADIETKQAGNQTVYQYNAGNFNTAIISGLNFAFGKNTKQTFTVGIHYLKGFGSKLDTKTITTVSGNKLSETSLESETSAWSVKMGIPVGFAKKKPAAKPAAIEKIYKEEKKCGQYKMQYKPRCSKTYDDQ